MYFKAYVTPGAKRERVEQKGNTFHISVREPAERNLANTRVRHILAERLRVPVGKVRILAGHRSPSKVFSVTTEGP